MNPKLQVFVRDTTRRIFAGYCGPSDARIEPITPPSKPWIWQSFILVTAPEVKIYTNFQFNMTVVGPLLAQKLGVPTCEDREVGSFMLEFCNIVGGYIKAGIDANGFSSELSLPLHTTYPLDLRFNHPGDQLFKDSCAITWEQEAIGCTFELIVSKPGCIDTFDFASITDQTDETVFF